MGKSRNRARRGRGDYWQSADYNTRTYAKNLSMLLSLAMNRFRWVNLPDTCDARFLELQLHKTGIATICHADDMPDVWQSLIANPYGEFNCYGIPVKWRATGYDQTNYNVTPETGELIYYSFSRQNPWTMLDLYARKLMEYERTAEINLYHQRKPVVFIAPQEKKLELVNMMKQVDGFEPVVMGDGNFSNLVDEVKAIDTKVPLITEDLERSWQNCLNQALLYLGIPHLAFEKGERMIEDEARANTAPTNIMLLDCLQARRQACDVINRKFGLNLEVYFNDDWESYNFNYTNNVESLAQDKVILSQDESFNGLIGGAEND